MKEAGDLLSQFSSQESIIRFILLLLPGFIAVAVYDLRVPGERRKFGEMAIALVVYSLLCDIVGLVGYLTISRFSVTDARVATPQFFIFFLIVGIVLPGALGWFAFNLRNWLSKNGYAIDPMPKAWDIFFNRLTKSEASLVLAITLSNGQKVGGFWDAYASTSTYPADEDILIGTPCRINSVTGAIEDVIRGSQGILLKRQDIISIEAFIHPQDGIDKIGLESIGTETLQ